MKLKSLLIIVFTSVCIGATAIVAYYADHTIQKQTSAKIESELTLKTLQMESSVNSWIQGKAQVTEGIAALMNKGIGNEVTPEYLNQVLLSPSNKDDVSDIYVGTANGTMIDGSLWVPDSDFDPRTRLWYQLAEENKSTVFTEPYVDAVTGSLVVSIAQPITGNSGKLQGVLAMDLQLDAITQIVASEKIGKTGSAFMIDQNGVILAHSDENLRNTDLSEMEGMGDLAKKMLSNDSGMEKYTYQNENKILVFQKLPSTSWVVAVTIQQSEVYAELVKSRITFVFILLSVLAVVLLICFISANRITRPIKKLTEVARITSNGDLCIQANDKGAYEIRELAKAFNLMSDSIRKLVIKISDASALVSHSCNEVSQMAVHTKMISEEISNTSDELAKGAQSQAESATHGADMVSNMSESIKQVTAASVSSYDMILNVSTSVEDGIKVINDQAILMKKNKESTSKVEYAISELEEKSHVISKIVDVIRAIAEQTNLLALNAAIEAARAGEHGKGFAVVADEVRNLAEQSAKSSSEIEGLLKDIQEKTRQSVAEAADVQKVVTEQESSLEKTRLLYQAIENEIKKIVDQTNSITEETNHLQFQSEQVAQAISDVAAITEESAAATEEVASSTLEQSSSVGRINDEVSVLVTEANQLLEIISYFKIS